MGGDRESKRAVAENWRENAGVGCKPASGRRKTRGGVWKRDKSEKSQTPRLRAPVGTPGETGVGRPDGRKSEACEGAGPGSGGVTGDPVAGRVRKRHTRDTWTLERCWVVNGVGVTYKGPG